MAVQLYINPENFKSIGQLVFELRAFQSSDFVLRPAVVIYIESTPFSDRIWPDVAPICGPNGVANSSLVFR